MIFFLNKLLIYFLYSVLIGLFFYCIYVCVCVCMCVSRSVMSDSLQPHRLWPTRLLCLWDSPGKNTGVGCHFLLQGIFPTQGSNPVLLHHRQVLYCLSYREVLYIYIYIYIYIYVMGIDSLICVFKIYSQTVINILSLFMVCFNV